MSHVINPRRLRYVTSNFFDLQGLRQVATGVTLLMMIAAMELRDPWNLLLMGLLLLLQGLCWWRIGIYYEGRLGFVDAGARPLFWGQRRSILRQSVFWFGTILLSVTAAKMMSVEVLTPEWGLGILFAAFFFLDDRPWYYLPFALLFLSLAVLNRTARSDLMLSVGWIAPWAFIITGMLDHRLLVSSLGGAPSNGDA